MWHRSQRMCHLRPRMCRNRRIRAGLTGLLPARMRGMTTKLKLIQPQPTLETLLAEVATDRLAVTSALAKLDASMAALAQHTSTNQSGRGFYSVLEVAEYLHVSRATVQRLIAEERLPVTRVRQTPRVSAADLHDYIAANR